MAMKRRSLFPIVGVVVAGLLAAACAPANPSAGLRPLAVAAVQVEVGVGSPIPVEVVASGDWPDLCAQLAEVKQSIQDGQIEIELWATPADPNCPPDNVGVPFRVAVPLNVVQLAPGAYTVVVNGVQTEFAWPAG
jgi:hypothetical protein